MQTFIFDVRGMTCGGCAGNVQRALGKIDGIGDGEATLRPGVATMRADSARVTAAWIEAALGALGHAATLRPAGRTTAAQPRVQSGGGVASRWTVDRAG